MTRKISILIGGLLLVVMLIAFASAQPSAPVGNVEAGPPVYAKSTGYNLISVNLYDVDIREALSSLAMEQEINIVAGQNVSGKISLHLNQATLDDALDAITLAGKLGGIKGEPSVFYPKKKRFSLLEYIFGSTTMSEVLDQVTAAAFRCVYLCFPVRP